MECEVVQEGQARKKLVYEAPHERGCQSKHTLASISDRTRRQDVANMSKAIGTALGKLADKEQVTAALHAVLLRDYSDLVGELHKDDPRSVITSNIKEALEMLRQSTSEKARNAKAIIESAALGNHLTQQHAIDVLAVRRQAVINAQRRREEVNNMEAAQAKAAALHTQARWVCGRRSKHCSPIM
jgi:hypothetical protein